MQFISLAEFLTLDDGFCNYAFSGVEWLLRYELAQESFNKNPLPQVGASVLILVNGCNTHLPEIRSRKDLGWLPKAVVASVDDKYVRIERNGQPYLINVENWWFKLYTL